MRATFSDYVVFFLIVFGIIFLVHAGHVHDQQFHANHPQYIRQVFSQRPNNNQNTNESNDYNNYNHTYYYNSNDNQ